MFWRGGVCPWRRRRAYPVANNEDTTSLAAHLWAAADQINRQALWAKVEQINRHHLWAKVGQINRHHLWAVADLVKVSQILKTQRTKNTWLQLRRDMIYDVLQNMHKMAIMTDDNKQWLRKNSIMPHLPEDFLFFLGIWICTGTSGLKNSWTWLCRHKYHVFTVWCFYPYFNIMPVCYSKV